MTSQKNLELIGDNYPNYKYLAKKKSQFFSNFIQKWPKKTFKSSFICVFHYFENI